MSLKELTRNLDDRGNIGLISYSNSHEEDSYLWALIHNQVELSPEKALMLALIEDAVHCINHCHLVNVVLDTWAWINSSDSEYLFSFENCCTSLGLAPDYVRKQIKCLTKKPLTEYSKAS